VASFSDPGDLAGLVPTDQPLLLALDFDGTLAHLVDNPDDARMTVSARTALDHLAATPGVTVAIVSGRGAQNLADVSSPDSSWWLVGSHGMEVIPPGHPVDDGFGEDFRRDRATLWDAFGAVARQFPGTWVENKTFGAALHTRGLAAEVEMAAHEALWPVIRGFNSDLTTRTGHGILEASLGSRTKGDGIAAVKSAVTPSLTVFIGDDVTDEDGFQVLKTHDIGIKVGSGETRASHRLRGPDDVAEFLENLAQRGQ
jgi:trehalose 6-phosphate synthase/phosphatase